MSLKPQPTRWFELLVARDDLEPALEALAVTGAVELEIHGAVTTQLVLSSLQERLDEYHRLAERYRHYWPPEQSAPLTTPMQADEILEWALAQIRTWGQQVDPHIQRLERLEAEYQELELLQEFLSAAAHEQLDMGLLAQAGPVIEGRVYTLPIEAAIQQPFPGVINRQISGPRHRFLIALGAREAIAELGQQLAALKGRIISLPDWLGGSTRQALAQVRERRGRLDQELDRSHTLLDEFSQHYRLAEALGEVARLRWFVSHAQGLPVSENFAWISGWTSDVNGDQLNAALTASHIRALLRFPPPPPDKIPPVLLHNPGWVRPFELFARLLGIPGRDEIDPSTLLAVIVPLLFGYMFGDVGQGLVLFLAGLALQRRWPALRLLIPCGLSAMVFGLLFGSLFSREDLLPALWLHPLEQPLTVLTIPLIGGIALILLGLLLNGLETAWRGRLITWWKADAALLVMYLSLIGALLQPALLWATAAALVWYLMGSMVEQRGRQAPPIALLGALGQLFEHLLQLAVNTVSFARVGAFALAHAGLSQAIASLADAVDHPLTALLILVLGNAVVILIEGLVVSVQTTRLILFEFFIRFLRGEGRVFRPLSRPATFAIRRTS